LDYAKSKFNLNFLGKKNDFVLLAQISWWLKINNPQDLEATLLSPLFRYDLTAPS